MIQRALNARILLISTIILSTVSLAACLGSDSSLSAGGTTGTGTVALLITDAPTTDFDQVNVTITGASLIPAGDGSHASIYTGQRTIDLLDLRDHAELFSLVDVAVGRYGKIRLDVAAIELVRLDSDGEIDEVIHPRLPSGRIDLNPRGEFEILPGETLILQIDIDASKSIHVVQAGNSGHYNFRPVVFVDILDGTVPARFVKLDGIVDAVDTGSASFVLCGAFDYGNQADNDQRCLTVVTNDETSVFTAGGLTAFDAIVAGDPATTIGQLQPVEAGVELSARLVWLGENDALVRVRGTVDSAPDTDSGRFGIVAGYSAEFEPGRLLDAGLINGARILSRSGEILTTDAIQPGLETRVLAIRGDDEADLEILVMFLPDPGQAQTRLRGAVGTINSAGESFVLMPLAGEEFSSDILIDVSAATILLISDADGTEFTSAAITIDELESAWRADVYGRHVPHEGVFRADTVIVFDDLTENP